MYPSFLPMCTIEGIFQLFLVPVPLSNLRSNSLYNFLGGVLFTSKWCHGGPSVICLTVWPQLFWKWALLSFLLPNLEIQSISGYTSRSTWIWGLRRGGYKLPHPGCRPPLRQASDGQSVSSFCWKSQYEKVGGTNPWQLSAASRKVKCVGLTSQCLKLLGWKRPINRSYLEMNCGDSAW